MPLGKSVKLLECKEFAHGHPRRNNIAGKNRIDHNYLENAPGKHRITLFRVT